MSMYQIPEWSSSASQSIGLHYRELQDIEVYVEDADSEALYTKLLSRSVNNAVRIKKIIPLNGRGNVVDKCKGYNENFPALFIVDGDLDLLHGEREGAYSRLFQHRLYCLENYLFCPTASAELLQDSSGKLMQVDALALLEWDSFTESLEPLIELFKVYAISWKLMPEESTVSRSYHNMCRKISRKRGSVLCKDKINTVIKEIKDKIVKHSSLDEYENVYELVSNKVTELEHPLYSVSGKDYLLKALRDYLGYKGANLMFDESFKFKLARYCDTAPLAALAEAVIMTANGQQYTQS